MQSWTVNNFGHYKEQLVLEERDLPPATGSDALIKVKAVGINFRGYAESPSELS